MTNTVQINAATQLANLGEELNVPFLKLLGVRLISAEMGKGEILLALKPEHTNTWEVNHNGRFKRFRAENAEIFLACLDQSRG